MTVGINRTYHMYMVLECRLLCDISPDLAFFSITVRFCAMPVLLICSFFHNSATGFAGIPIFSSMLSFVRSFPRLVPRLSFCPPFLNISVLWLSTKE